MIHVNLLQYSTYIDSVNVNHTYYYYGKLDDNDIPKDDTEKIKMEKIK